MAYGFNPDKSKYDLTENLAAVALSGNYNDLNNKPDSTWKQFVNETGLSPATGYPPNPRWNIPSEAKEIYISINNSYSIEGSMVLPKGQDGQIIAGKAADVSQIYFGVAWVQTSQGYLAIRSFDCKNISANAVNSISTTFNLKAFWR